MKVVLIILACIFGMVVYEVIGTGVFLLWAKCESLDWKEDIRKGDDNSAVFGCIAFWPVLVVYLVVSMPVRAIFEILGKLAKR